MIFFKNSRTKVLDHWYTLFENYEMSSADFYQKVEGELTSRKIPGLHVSRTKWEEGGLLSANREYLRLTREKWVFDICAAPFGTGYFFSYRFTEIPIKINPWALLLSLIIILPIAKMLAIALCNWLGLVIAIISI